MSIPSTVGHTNHGRSRRDRQCITSSRVPSQPQNHHNQAIPRIRSNRCRIMIPKKHGCTEMRTIFIPPDCINSVNMQSPQCADTEIGSPRLAELSDRNTTQLRPNQLPSRGVRPPAAALLSPNQASTLIAPTSHRSTRPPTMVAGWTGWIRAELWLAGRMGPSGRKGAAQTILSNLIRLSRWFPVLVSPQTSTWSTWSIKA